MFLDLLLPEPRPDHPVPAVVYIHGGGWRSGDKAAGLYPWHSPLFASHGYVANAGEYAIDAERIGVWGDSAGGHLAALLGVTGDVPEFEGECGNAGESAVVQAVIARCAPTDFTVRDMESAEKEVIGPLFGGSLSEQRELARLASPAIFVRPGMPPFLVVHGTRDETVPFKQAERLVESLRAHGNEVTFHVVEHGRHSLLPEDDRPWGNHPWTELGQEALEFFDRTLRPAP